VICQSREDVLFGRYLLNLRTQEEEAYGQYKTALCELAEGCDFEESMLAEMKVRKVVGDVTESEGNKVDQERIPGA